MAAQQLAKLWLSRGIAQQKWLHFCISIQHNLIMQPVNDHPWDLTPQQALNLQRELAARVITHDQLDKVKLVAGTDVSYQKHGDRLVAAVVVLNAHTLEVVEIATAEATVQFPYIPGLFSFRELPPLLQAFAQLQHTPDLVVCDGQGLAHPRRFGLACHLGVLFDIPSIGCGKTRLIGQHTDPAPTRGASAPLLDKGETIGQVLRTKTHIQPLYVSIGHRVSLNTACDWVLKLAPKYRLPETTRQADQLVKRRLSALTHN